MIKVFLDTNIVVDFLAIRTDFYDMASKIVALAYNSSIKLYASSLTFSTASYVLAKHHANTPKDIRLTIADFIKICDVTVVDSSSVEFATTDVFDDFEDAMQYESACKAGCEAIVTRNTKDFTASEIPVIEPRDFLNLFEEDKDK